MKTHFESLLNESTFSKSDKNQILTMFNNDLKEKNKYIYIHKDTQNLFIKTDSSKAKEYESYDMTKEELYNVIFEFVSNHNSSTKQFVSCLLNKFKSEPEFFKNDYSDFLCSIYNHISQDYTRLIYGSKKVMDSIEDAQSYSFTPFELFNIAISAYIEETLELYLKTIEQFKNIYTIDEMITFIIAKDLTEQFHIK
jgi:hypothetical protein